MPVAAGVASSNDTSKVPSVVGAGMTGPGVTPPPPMEAITWLASVAARVVVPASGGLTSMARLVCTNVAIWVSDCAVLVAAVMPALLLADLRIDSICAFRPPAMTLPKPSALTALAPALTSVLRMVDTPTRCEAAFTSAATTDSSAVVPDTSTTPLRISAAMPAMTSLKMAGRAGLAATLIGLASLSNTSVVFCASCWTARVFFSRSALTGAPSLARAGSVFEKSMPAAKPSDLAIWSEVIPSASSVVRGLTTVEPKGALSLPVNARPVSTLVPPITTKAAPQAGVNLKNPLESVDTVASPMSAEPLLLASQSTVAPLK